MEKSIRMGFFVSLLFVADYRTSCLYHAKKGLGERESIIKSFCKLIIDKSRMVFHTIFSFRTLGQGFIADTFPYIQFYIEYVQVIT